MSQQTILLIVLLVIPRVADAELVTHFNFNSYDGDSSVIAADSGAGIIVLTSPAGGAAWDANSLSASPGSGRNLNAVDGDPTGTSLGLEGAGNNGGALTIEFSTLGYRDLLLSFAIAGTGSGFDSVQLAYSINGTDFANFGSAIDPQSFEIQSFDLSGIDSLDSLDTAFLRLSLGGAINAAGQNQTRIDNLQINATAVPEAPAWAMMIAAMMLLAVAGWRRRSRVLLPHPS